MSNHHAAAASSAAHQDSDLEDGREEAHATYLESLLQVLPATIRELQDARGTGPLAQANSYLEELGRARDVLEEDVHSQPSHYARRAPLIDRASQAIASLYQLVENKRALEDPQRAGVLAGLPHAPVPLTPEETRVRAHQFAPVPECDDPTRQAAESQACSLTPEQRAVARKKAEVLLRAAGENWAAALGDAMLVHRVKPLLAHDDGANALVQLLLGVALGAAGSALASSIATRAVPPAASISMVGSKITVDEIPAPYAKLSESIGKSMGQSAAKLAKVSQEHAGDFESAFGCAISDIRSEWEATTQIQIDYLSDPALVALGDGLEQSSERFKTDLFKARIAKLLERFDGLDQKLGVPDVCGEQELQLAIVAHPSGTTRLALVNPGVRRCVPLPPEVALVADKGGIAFHTDKIEFMGWVDGSLTGIAQTIAQQRKATHPMLTLDDPRWSNRHRSLELVTWANNPNSNEDVSMLGGR